jgi:GNAT superfamily N-acetyltransferase
VLDRTVPYFDVIMKRPAGVNIPLHVLPKGFSLMGFTEGKEIKWAEIETAVGEFKNTALALAYFQERYLPHTDELRRRLMFVQTENGEDIGTITSWWNYTGSRRDPSVHWLAVRSEYQGMGIGTALVSACLQRLREIEGDKDVYLHTQTWSHRAIGIYLKLGFKLVRQETFGDYRNEYEWAMPVLRSVMPSLRE